LGKHSLPKPEKKRCARKEAHGVGGKKKSERRGKRKRKKKKVREKSKTHQISESLKKDGREKGNPDEKKKADAQPQRGDNKSLVVPISQLSETNKAELPGDPNRRKKSNKKNSEMKKLATLTKHTRLDSRGERRRCPRL